MRDISTLYDASDHPMTGKRYVAIISHMTVLCPKCNSNDLIQKVTVLVEGGTAKGSSDVTFTQTALASKLAFSPRPIAASAWTPGRIATIVVPVLLIVISICFVADSSTDSFARSEGEVQSDRVVKVFMALLCGLPSLLIGIIATVTGFLKEHQLKQEFGYESSRWAYGAHRWSMLYYCGRDDLVFVESRPHLYSPASDMMGFLYSDHLRDILATGR